MDPIVLGPNTPDTFYRGDGRISAFRGIEYDAHPEDWIASATSRFGASPRGLTTLGDHRLLAEAIAAEPLDWLGPAHVGRFGVSPALLVKLLDAGERLPLHVHPDRQFATEHLASPFGKTEAWVILEAPADAAVHLGFNHDIDAVQLSSWVREQAVEQLLAATNRVAVRPGDALLCPAGMPHAIGAGILLLELQEPTDFSVLLEWEGFALTADDATLGLSLDVALECVDRGRCGPERLAQLRGRPDAVGSLLPTEADGFFVAERVSAGLLAPAFAVLVVTAGAGRLTTAGGATLAIERGQTIVIPFAAGAVTIAGSVTAIRCRAGG